MSDGLPRQCRWSDFVRIVQSLGYEELRSRRDGSARSFHHPSRQPRVATFHKPHPEKVIRPGTLRAYIRQLGLSREEFLGRLRNDH